MRLVIFILLTVLVIPVLQSNDRLVTVLDTVQIDGVVVSQVVPLDFDRRQQQTDMLLIGSIDDINERLGSVSTVCRGGYAKEPTIQGFSGGQMNVTIDGMRVFGACTDRMDPVTSYVEPVNLSHLVVQNGLNAGSTGTNIGGSYDMNLKNAVFKKNNWGISTEFQSVSNGKTVQSDINIGKSKWAYRASGLWKNFSSYVDGTGETVPYTQYNKLNLYQNLAFKIDKVHLLSFKALIDDASDIGYPALPMDVSKANAQMYSADFEYNKPLKNWSQLRWKAYANTIYHQMDDSERDSLFFVENNGRTDSVYMRMDMPGWSRTTGSFVSGKFMKWKSHDVFFKGEFFQHWSKAEMTMRMNNLSFPGEPNMFVETWPENTRKAYGVYLKDDLELNKKWNIAASYRIDYAESEIVSEQGQRQWQIFNYNKIIRSDFLHVIKIQGVHKINKSNQLSLTLANNQRLPSASELYGFYLFNALDGHDYLGNPELKKEQSNSIQFKYRFLKSKIKLNYEIDYHHIQDYIYGSLDRINSGLNLYASGLKTYINVPKANIFSTNLQLSWKPKTDWTFFNVLKYTRGRIGAENMPLIQPLQNILSAKYQKKNAFVRLEYIYSAPQNRINQSFGEVTTNHYSVVNLTLRYMKTLNKSTIIFNAGIQNVLDAAYSDHLDWGTFNRPGRNISFGIGLRF